MNPHPGMWDVEKGAETMSVITITREFGSEGDYIAKKVAQSLGYHLVNKEFIGTVLSQYGLVEFDREYETLPSFWEKFDAQRETRREVMLDMLQRVVHAVAQHGDVVILGRSGFSLLGGFADVLHVRLQAPLAVRVQRVMAQQEITTEQAETVVKEGDRLQAAFVEELCGASWEAINAFDLVVNTGKIPSDLVTTWVVNAVKAFAVSQKTDQLTTGSIEVDPILAKAVSELLQCKVAHG
jgi:cytidylate kinase